MRRVLEAGADPNIVGPGRGESLEDIEKFYNNNIKERTATSDQYGSPLHYAAQAGNDDIVKLLLDFGADGHAFAWHLPLPRTQ